MSSKKIKKSKLTNFRFQLDRKLGFRVRGKTPKLRKQVELGHRDVSTCLREGGLGNPRWVGTLVENIFNILLKIFSTPWWKYFQQGAVCSGIKGCSDLESIQLPPGSQEVHNCSQKGGWVARMLKIFPQDAPSCPYKYWLVTLRASSCLLAASSHITSRVVTTH